MQIFAASTLRAQVWESKPLSSTGACSTTSPRVPTPAGSRPSSSLDRANALAEAGQPEEAIEALTRCIPAIERAPGWATNYPLLLHYLAGTLFWTHRPDHLATLEQNLHTKVLDPDYRYIESDARWTAGRLCAAGDRTDEAHDWFNQARKPSPTLAVIPYESPSTTKKPSCSSTRPKRRGVNTDQLRAHRMHTPEHGPVANQTGTAPNPDIVTAHRPCHAAVHMPTDACNRDFRAGGWSREDAVGLTTPSRGGVEEGLGPSLERAVPVA